MASSLPFVIVPTALIPLCMLASWQRSIGASEILIAFLFCA